MSRLLSYACAATLFAGLIAVAGCGGGGGEGSVGASGSLSGKTVQGGAMAPSTPTPVPASGGVAVTVPVTVNGVTTNQTVVVPSLGGVTATVPANSPLFIINAGSTLLTGSFGSGGVGIGSDLASAIANIPTSGVTLSNLGAFLQNIGLPVDPVNGTKYVIALPQGNVSTRAAAKVKTTRDLTIGSTTCTGTTYVVGLGSPNFYMVSPFPLNYTGTIPNNGENAAGSSEYIYWGPGNQGRDATLTITYGNGFVLTETRNIQPDPNNPSVPNAPSATFKDLSVDTSNVPAGGVQTVALSLSDIVPAPH